VYRWVFLGLLLGALSGSWAQKAQCILVKLKRSPELTADNALHPSWEEKSIKIKLPSEDWEEAFLDTEEEKDRPISECFIPQIKLITERYTYIISLACGNLIAFQNSAPYQPSNRRVQSPITFTEELRYFLEKSIEKHLKIPPRRLYAEYSLAYVPPVQGAINYEELDMLVNQSQPIEEEDDEDPQPDEPQEHPSDWIQTEEDDLPDEN